MLAKNYKIKTMLTCFFVFTAFRESGRQMPPNRGRAVFLALPAASPPPEMRQNFKENGFQPVIDKRLIHRRFGKKRLAEMVACCSYSSGKAA